MLAVEDIRERLRNHKLIRVAAEVGLDRTTLSAVMKENGKAKPSYKTLRILSEYLEGSK